MKVALIVEGPADREAMPTLVARTGDLFEDQFYAPDPIKTGGFHVLRRPGQLERFVTMAGQRPGVDVIVVCVDLDDDCPAEEAEKFHARVEGMNLPPGHPAVRACFMKREYECLFLCGIESLVSGLPEYDWDKGKVWRAPEDIRDAKGAIQEAMRRNYKEMVHQKLLTAKLDLKALFSSSRSYRRFMRAITGFSYEELEALV